MLELWRVDFGHFFRYFDTSFEIGLCTEQFFGIFGRSESTFEDTFNDEDHGAQENDKDEDTNAGNDSNLHFCEVFHKILHFSKEDLKICWKIDVCHLEWFSSNRKTRSFTKNIETAS